MRVSKLQVNPFLSKELSRVLYQTIADLKTPQEAEQFLKAFLAEAELITLTKRLAVAYSLDRKQGYRNIRENLKVSTATIAKIKIKLENDGVRIALQKIKTEEWANLWSEKIRKFVKVG